MKYVIFKYRHLLMPIIFPEHVTHSQVKLEDVVVRSAGFWRIKDDGDIEVYGESESLNIGTMEGDDELLRLTLGNFNSSFFIDL